MAIGSDNKNPKLYLTTGVTPATPSSGDWKLYAKANGIFAMGSNATEVGPFSATGLANPMTTQGDVIYSSDNSGTPARLAESSNASKILTSGGSGANPSWGQGPMTTTGDLMIGASGGVPTRLGVGTASQALVGGTTPAWSSVVGILQSASVTRTAADLTTTSTTFVDATSLTVTLTTGARRCLVFFNCTVKNNTNGQNTAVDIAVDGALQGQTYGLALFSPGLGGAGAAGVVSLTFLTAVLTAASHTIKIQWRVDGGTGTMFASTGVAPAILNVIETGLTT